MDGKGGLGVRSWNFSDQAANVNSVFKSMSDARVHGGAILDGSSGLSGHQSTFLKIGAFPHRNPMISEAAEIAGWVHQRNYLSDMKATPNPMQANKMNPEMGGTHTVIGAPVDTQQNSEFETKPTKLKKQLPSANKSSHIASKVLRVQQSKKKPSHSTKKQDSSEASSTKREKKNPNAFIDGTALDPSCVPTPICSCTGVPRRCYKWGAGGWQSSCCTTTISEFPLPMSLSRPSARMAGRKMSNGAYLKLLQKLAAEGHNLSNPVDLKNHWARHGTNKFVTIR